MSKMFSNSFTNVFSSLNACDRIDLLASHCQPTINGRETAWLRRLYSKCSDTVGTEMSQHVPQPGYWLPREHENRPTGRVSRTSETGWQILILTKGASRSPQAMHIQTHVHVCMQEINKDLDIFLVTTKQQNKGILSKTSCFSFS